MFNIIKIKKMNKEKKEFVKKLKFLMSIVEESNLNEEYLNLLNEELENIMLDYTDYYDED